MPKYNKRIVTKICDLIKKDSYTIAEICVSVGISERCYYQWQSDIAEFAVAIQKAKDEFIAKNLIECERSLVKIIKGYEYEEKKTVTVDNGAGQPKIKEQTITKKVISPNLGAIIHFQTNKDPQNWKNRQNTELTGKDGKDLFEKLTDEELESKIKELEKKNEK
jgi:hypothetical protein